MNQKFALSIYVGALLLALGFGLSPVAAQASTPIDCTTTPFGKGDRMVQDDEFISLYSNLDNSSNGFGEYRLPFAGETDPLTQAYSSNLFPAGSGAAQFWTATNVDLNGDGRAEVAAVYGGIGSNQIVIAVFERTPGFVPAAQLLGTWTLDLGASGLSTLSVALTAGDFSGTSTRQQQLALMWRSLTGPDDGRLNVIVLTGAADGSIANADNTWAGRWKSAAGQYNQPSLTHGDFLLDGRDQIAVVSVHLTTLTYELLEYNDQGTNAQVNSGLPIASGDTAIGSKEFASDISTFTDDAFDATELSQSYCSGTSGPCTERPLPLTEPNRIVASGGDIVDSAAAELVVHLSFFANLNVRDKFGTLTNTSPVGQYLGQRLVHFAVTQAVAGGDISDVELANSGAGRDFDSSQIPGFRILGLPGSEATSTDFDATIGAVDGQEKQSVALVRVVSGGNGQLETDIYKASVRLHAGFQYTVHAATGPFPVDFSNTSTGDVQDVSWDFGDGSSSVAVNPSHSYNATGTYTVTLTITDSGGKTNLYSSSVSISGQTGAGGVGASYSYQMATTPVYSAATQDQFVLPDQQCTSENIYNSFSAGAAPHIAIGDMNRDGFAEIMTTAQSDVWDKFQGCFGNDPSVRRATIWRSLWRIDPAQYTFSGTHAQQVVASAVFPPPLPYTSAAMLASDFDGDSTYATLGGDCRAVSEPQLRELIWMPPFFQAMQSGSLDSGFIAASFGINERSGGGIENRSGSYTGDSVSGYVGIQAGNGEDPISKGLFKFVFQTSLKFTAGHDWQSEHGAIHGSDIEYDYSEGQSASVGEGLVVAEADDADCYSYDVMQSTGAVPNSALRMCRITYQERTAMTAETWNNQADYAGVSPNWVPLQRDWASLALFHKPTSTIPFSAGKGLENATDGLFSTAAVSVATTEPYLDIDLGSVQDISSIRVFPAASTDVSGQPIAPLAFNKAALDLQGFRIYASTTPFAGSGVPGGSNVSVFAQDTHGEQVYDRWNIFTLDDDFSPLRARYIRLQHPGQNPARINISQIQIFGDAHSDPPAFPDAVCDQTPGDGRFLARVWNPVDRDYQNIEARGDLTWSGTNGTQQPTGVKIGGQDCFNHSDVRESTIWNNLRIGNTGITNSWDSTSDTTNTVGSYDSMDSATRVGTEFDQEFGGPYVQEVAGVSYEHTFGINSETQSTSFWGNGLQIGGAVGGFDASFQNLVLPCGYFPHPYAYHLSERGNASYQHDLYVVDYIVHQPNNSSAWQRGAVPLVCTGNDRIFANGFDN